MSEEVKKEQPKEITLTNGMALGNTVEERWRVCQLYSKSNMLPKCFDTAEKVFIGLQYAIELGFASQPLTVLRNMAVINGQPAIWGELPLALVRRSGELEFIKEFFVDSSDKILPPTCTPEQIFAAICVIKRKNYDEKTFAFTKADKTKLGVAAIWQQFEKIMMKRKARSLALKDEFGDVLLGVQIAEYDNHIIPNNNVVDADPEKMRAEELTNTFKEQ